MESDLRPNSYLLKGTCWGNIVSGSVRCVCNSGFRRDINGACNVPIGSMELGASPSYAEIILRNQAPASSQTTFDLGFRTRSPDGTLAYIQGQWSEYYK
ncbi:unnamed protein product [Protopolystoma xenopodis]|uniref:Uncharacterized protein n=1 Tax=Protopolystoma xenopodis TaxID=117903 RepID=A0A448WJN8_9PLAT|nr:unnamed protein product [Protopolystoma xenopodis]